MTAEAVLEVRGLTKRFDRRSGLLRPKTPGVLAVDDVSFEVHPGTTVGIVGESGSGKTTLGRMIVGLTTRTAGTVVLDGADTRGMKARSLHERLQYVFQDPYSALNPRRTVAQSLEVPMRYLQRQHRQGRRDRVAELAEQVGLSRDMVSRYPHELSGGQRQRAVIARALAARADVLVLDEPVSALDVSVQAQILALLRTLQNDLGLTFLFISHDLAVVESLSHEVVVMQQGRVVEKGARDQIFDAPADPYTRRLLAAVPGSGELRSRKPRGAPEEDAGGDIVNTQGAPR